MGRRGRRRLTTADTDPRPDHDVAADHAAPDDHVVAANLPVAADLREIAALLGLQRGERFRARAFRTAARLVASLPLDVAELSATERRALDGVGAAVDRAIAEHLDTGTSRYLARLRAEHPPGVGQLVQVMGVSPRIATAMSQDGVTDLDGVARLIAEGRLRDVPGVGERTAEVIADGLGRVALAVRQGLPPLRVARLESVRWARRLEALPGVVEAVVAGDVRRGVAQPRDLIVVVVLDGSPALDDDALRALDGVVRGMDEPPGPGATALLTSGGRRLVVHRATPATRGTALVVATGSTAYATRVRERTPDGVGPHAEEDDAIRAAGLVPVPPPLREVDAPPDPDRLVQPSDLQGDCHVHTDFSGDGRDPIDELARAAAARGYAWLALTDHAEDLAMNGLSREDLRRRDAAIDRAQPGHPSVRLLKGLELNIGLDGDVDYDPDVLAGQDWCIASIHSTFQRSEAVQTQRILTAIANPHVHAIGHPFGRMLGTRPGYAIDLHAIAQAAAETGTALEVNGSPPRLDLGAEWVAVAVAAGAPLVLDSDAHRAAELDYVVEAVLTAQRGGAPLHLVRNATADPHGPAVAQEETPAWPAAT